MKYTNNQDSIFALVNLPEIIKGALFSRYSRSDKGLRELLNDEFLNNEDLDTDKADEFYERLVLGYGDSSVLELGSAHLACEKIPILNAMEMQDCRVGISFLEKSTRYILFDKIEGQYPYYIPLDLGEWKEPYIQTMNNLFDTYWGCFDEVEAFVKALYPQGKASNRAYKAAVKAQTLDMLRGLLPLSTYTYMGIHGNARGFENLLFKLRASKNLLSNFLTLDVQQELDKVIGAFMKRPKSDKGLEYSKYLQSIGSQTAHHLAHNLQSRLTRHVCGISLKTSSEPEALKKVLGHILWKENSSLSKDDCEIAAYALNKTTQRKILSEYLEGRTTRHQRPGRAFELVEYDFEVTSSIGAFRDLNRHRMCLRERQDFTTELGYYTPAELRLTGVLDRYTSALEEASKLWKQMPEGIRDYCLPLAEKVRWRMKLNLRELYHLCELRTGLEGMEEYRRVAQDMYALAAKNHPMLVEGMKFVNLGEGTLCRLASEVKKDKSCSV